MDHLESDTTAFEIQPGGTGFNRGRDDPLPMVLSVYLDVVRTGASVVVVLHHAWPILFPDFPLPWPGHDAVVVFFVLSGLVISHAANRRGLTLADYALQRAARIGSVVVPALALSAVVSVCVGGAGLGDPGSAVTGWLDGTERIGASLVYVGQIWWLEVNPPLDTPFWSINFEVWYYALFGAWVFLTGGRRAVAVAAVCLFVGPKILLLLPVWLLGVALYYHRLRLSEGIALIVLMLSMALALAFIQFDVSVAIRNQMHAHWPAMMDRLGGANQFVGDWVLALIVGLNFTAAASLGRYGAALVGWVRPVRAAAGCAFSAYLYHMPLLAVACLLLGLRGWAALLAVAIGIAVLAQLTERQLPAVRRILGIASDRRSVPVGPALPR